MRKIILALSALLFTTLSYAGQFSIAIPAGSSTGASTDTVTVSCSQRMATQNLTMSCTLPGQTNSQYSTVDFYQNGITLSQGTEYIKGITNNTPETAILNSTYNSSNPNVYQYTPKIHLSGWKASESTLLTCTDVQTKTAFCKVLDN